MCALVSGKDFSPSILKESDTQEESLTSLTLLFPAWEISSQEIVFGVTKNFI